MSCSRKQADLARAVIALLAEQFPAAFSVLERHRKPLKLGIRDDVLAAMAGAVTAEEVTAALRFYTGNVGYLRTSIEGAPRVGLDGQPAGQVSADEAAHARERLATRRKRAVRSAPPKAVTTVAPRDGLAALRAAGRRRAAS
jgi:ProP effector